jgi:hypothetical protein
MNELTTIERDSELLKAMRELPQPRTDYVLQKFVIGKHETPEMQYAHCVLNLRLKYNDLRRAKINLEKIDYEIELYKKKAEKNRLYEFKWKEKEIDREDVEDAVLGALRELQALYKTWKTFDKKYTRNEINELQEEYWDKRIIGQANDDLMASGRVSVGNLQSLRHIGKGVVPQLDHVREVEQNYLEDGNTKIMIAVATEHKAEKGLPCIDGLIIPSGVQIKHYNCYGRSIAEAYNDIAREFLKDGADYLLTVEDDTFPPEDALVRLLVHIKEGKKAVGAWYPKRQAVLEGAPIILKEGKRTYLEADGGVHEVKTLPMGCTLYTAEVFYKTTFPYFVRTENLTQDSFFSQKLTEAGFKMYIDTSIRCKHIDRETSVVYE